MNRGGRLALLLALLAGCPKPKQEPPPELVTTPGVAPVPTGRIVDGTYVDGTLPLSVAIPEGWNASVGDDGQEVRLTLIAPDGIRVVIATTRGDTLATRPLPGCTWTFEDRSRYRAVKVPAEVLAGTCTSDDPRGPRVLTWVVASEGTLVHVEATVPQGALRAGKQDLDLVAGGVRLR